MAPPRVLMSWHESPSYIPAPVLTPNQLTVGPRRSDEGPDVYSVVTPVGRYDLFDHLRRARVDTAFDLVVVSADAVMRNLPAGLGAFRCPVILLAGDTHHLTRPLRTLVAYARSEPFDLVVTCHNRHHMHWFAEAGLPRVAWLPGLTAADRPQPWQDRRRPGIVFVGQTGFHPRRARLIEALRRAGLPVTSRRATPDEAATLYAGAGISFNASLNGDLNLRVHEVLSAGGCLLTDRLASASGMAELLEEGRDHLAYGDERELIGQARELLCNPDRALALARAGHERFVAELAPSRQIARLLDWAAGATIEPRFAAVADPRSARRSPAAVLARRLERYEHVQERHRIHERVDLRIGAGALADMILDLADLPRLTLRLAPDADQARAFSAIASKLGARVEHDAVAERPIP